MTGSPSRSPRGCSARSPPGTVPPTCGSSCSPARATRSAGRGCGGCRTCGPGRSAGPVATVGTDETTTARRVADLVALLDARQEKAADAGGAPARRRSSSCSTARGALRLLPGMVRLLREGPAAGIAFLCLDDDVTLLPEECRTVVSSAYGAAARRDDRPGDGRGRARRPGPGRLVRARRPGARAGARRQLGGCRLQRPGDEQAAERAAPGPARRRTRSRTAGGGAGARRGR